MLISGVKQYEAFVKKVFGPVAMEIAGHQVQRLLGFWCVWHMLGGTVEGARMVGLPDRHIARSRKEFVQVFKVPVEDFLPELAQTLATGVKPSD